jgi:hypothetical protein
MDRAGAARRAQEDKVDKYLWRGVWAPRVELIATTTVAQAGVSDPEWWS